MSHINPSRVRAARVVVLAGMLAVPAAASAVPPGEQQSNPDTTSSAIRTTTGVDCEHPSEHPATGTTAEQRVSNPCEERAPGPPASTARGGGPRATNASSSSSSTGSSASSTRATSRRRSGAAATDATRPSGRQPGASSNPARGTPPARGGGPRSVPEDCGPNGVGPDGHCVAPDLAPDSPQQQWDRDPRLPPANQQNAPGPAAPQARAPEPGGTQ